MFRTVEWDLIGSVNATALSATNPNEWCAKRDFLELDRRGQRQPSTTTSGIAASLFQLQHLIGGPFAVNSKAPKTGRTETAFGGTSQCVGQCENPVFRCS